MQPGPFTAFIAQQCRVEEKTLAVYVRFLREAGLLTTGARGVHAPHMIPLDMARIVLALLATDKPAEAVEKVIRFGAMRICTDLTGKAAALRLFDGDPTLEQFLVRAFAYDPDISDSAFPYIEVRRNDLSAKVEISGMTVHFRTPGETSAEDRKERGGIWRISALIPAAVAEMAVGLWADRLSGCDENGHPLNLQHHWNLELRGEAYAARVREVKDYIRKRDVDWMKGAT